MFYICLFIIIISFFILLNFLAATLIYGGKKRLDFEKIKTFPKVSIFKPIKNSDDALADNLETFFRLDYPDFEIIFGIDADENDIRVIIENLKKRYSGISAKIVLVEKEKIMNPKVETLIAMEGESSGSLYWISDSNTRVDEDTLKNLVHEYITNDSKIVFSPIKGLGSKTFGSIMENAYLSSYVSGCIISGWKYIKKPVIVGKSMLIEKAALLSLGGFEYFKQFLAEDQVMGDTFYKKKIYISSNITWITNFNSHSTIMEFCSRISRWSKMRFHVTRKTYFWEIITYPIGLSLLFLPFLGARGLYLLAGSITLEVIFEYLNFFRVNTVDRKNKRIITLLPFSVILKDIIMLVIYFVPFFSSRVTWRGKHIKIGRDTRIFIEKV